MLRETREHIQWRHRYSRKAHSLPSQFDRRLPAYLRFLYLQGMPD